MSYDSLTPPNDVTALAPLLTINQVAQLLGVSRPTVYELIRDGALVPIRVRERARFDPRDIEAYLAAQRESGPEMREADGLPAPQPPADENVDGHGTA
jgi:excisionase family DNA binding protein